MATIPRAAPSRHRLSVDDFHRMAEVGILAPSERVELIDGEIIDMSPIGALHAAIVARLAALLTREIGSAAVVWCQNPIRLDDTSEPEPDIAIVRARADGYMTALPGPGDVLLVIEVADTSLAYDLGVKVPLYARHGIPDTWVIDAATRQTTRFRSPRDGRYGEETTHEPAEALSSPALVADSGAEITVALATLLPSAG
jgi:Uma2 family endonuclease